MQRELTNTEHWDSFWNRKGSGKIGPVGQYKRDVQRGFFRRYLPVQRGSMLELGCGGSEWMPFFASMGWEVSGLDYSERGCELAREELKRASVSGKIVLGDIFSPPEEMLGQYDLVGSWGVAEHFTDTAGYLQSAARFIRPGGWLFTGVPNFSGAVGRLYALIGPRGLATHVTLSRRKLENAHKDAGLNLLACKHVQIHDFALCDPDAGCADWKLQLQSVLKKYTAAVIRSRIPYPVNSLTATYIYMLAQKNG